MALNQNWTSEFSQSFKNLKDLYAFLEWETNPDLELVAKTYPIFIPKKLAKKIKADGPNGVLAKEFLPHELELDGDFNQSGMIDPIGDKEHFKAPQLIHRYHSRALFTPTSICPVHCRYCFRKNELNASEELFAQNFEKTLLYLNEHQEISEIIFTGGDPLTLSNERLEKYLRAFNQIPHLKDIRFHTRYPVIMPERIDRGFLELMEWASLKFRTVSIAIHANHSKEFDEENTSKIKELTQLNIQLLSQSVLLSGVNDSQEALLELFNLFLDLKIRPYYLHHPDRVKGGMHFYASLQQGRELYASLRNKLPGWAIPHYILDIPGGHGKISAFNPESTTFSGQILGKDGQVMALQEPDFFV